MTTQVQLMSVGELLQMRDDAWRHELVRGEPRRMAPAGCDHGAIAVNLTTPLDQHFRVNKLGKVYAAETGFVLSHDHDTVRAPNVAYVSRKRVEAAGRVPGYWPGAPDLAAEVFSHGDLYTEVAEKVAGRRR